MAGDGAATTIKNHTEDKPREIDFTEDILIADFGFWRYIISWNCLHNNTFFQTTEALLRFGCLAQVQTPRIRPVSLSSLPFFFWLLSFAFNFQRASAPPVDQAASIDR